tara:strand:- start:176 stop:529 length:354 start_codon:yes stop_codon:yes gene_type:complete
MITNNIGTILYSLLSGKKVGEDNQGNKFYVHKKNKKKRWVLYKKQIDPTSLEVEWQIWLTETYKDKEIIINKPSFKWQKNKKANLTGTLASYHPAKKSNRETVYFDKKNKNSVWKPD